MTKYDQISKNMSFFKNKKNTLQRLRFHHFFWLHWIGLYYYSIIIYYWLDLYYYIIMILLIGSYYYFCILLYLLDSYYSNIILYYYISIILYIPYIFPIYFLYIPYNSLYSWDQHGWAACAKLSCTPTRRNSSVATLDLHEQHAPQGWNHLETPGNYIGNSKGNLSGFQWDSMGSSPRIL